MFEQMLGVVDVPSAQQVYVRIRVAGRQGVVIEHLGLSTRRTGPIQDAWVGPEIDGELDIVGRYRNAVVPPHVPPQMKGPVPVVGRVFPTLCKRRLCFRARLPVLNERHKDQELGVIVAGDCSGWASSTVESRSEQASDASIPKEVRAATAEDARTSMGVPSGIESTVAVPVDNLPIYTARVCRDAIACGDMEDGEVSPGRGIRVRRLVSPA
jgi:hypothetical protein